MGRERIVSGNQVSSIEDKEFITLRPNKLDEYIGQSELKDKLKVTLKSYFLSLKKAKLK